MDVILKRNREMNSLLSEVISDAEQYNGRISPPTYMKIKKFFEEENIPEDMQERITEWEDLHGKDVREEAKAALNGDPSSRVYKLVKKLMG